MAYQILSIEEVARYLHLPLADVEKLVQNDEIPHETRGDRLVFVKQTIDAWASQRILDFQEGRLSDYHKRSLNTAREIFENDTILQDMIYADYICASMPAKTKASVLREMVDLAEKTGKVYDATDLLNSLEEREKLCSTALPGGLAMLHPRHHEPYLFESSFIVLARTTQDIHFGAPDGQPTRLFFLICCQDDRIHLHTLARICLMVMKTDLLNQLFQAPDASTMHDCLIQAEKEVLALKSQSNGPASRK